MNKNVFLILSLFIVSFSSAIAFDANISTNLDNVDLGNNINLRLEITNENGGSLQIDEIKGIENFDIISRSQSNSFSTRIAIINGETKRVTNSTNYIDFILSPKIDGNFILGPAIISDKNEVKQTNSLSINVVKNGNLQDVGVSNFENYNDQLYRQNLNIELNYLKYIPFIILIILFLIGISFYKLNPILFLKYKNNIFSLLNYENKKTEVGNNDKTFNPEKNNDFEDQNEFVYPDINDLSFTNKIENILKMKINKKYYIENFSKISYNEILEKLDNNLVDKEVIRVITEKINKLKYSNILVSKNEILELVKKI